MYKIKKDFVCEVIVRVADNAWIPIDPANSDYKQYLVWVEEGNTAEEWNQGE